MLGAHVREGYSTLFVCYQYPGSFLRLYDKLVLPVCPLLVFQGFQLTDFDKSVSFGRYSTFHGDFVVSSPDKRFCILLVLALCMAIAVMSNYTRSHYYFSQLSKFDQS